MAFPFGQNHLQREKNMQHRIRALLATIAVVLLTATPAQSTIVFEGRNANGAASTNCDVSGANKCTSFYVSSLDITILNDWSLEGFWSATSAIGSVQQHAEAAGFAATGLTGWVLPNNDGIGTIWTLWHAVGNPRDVWYDQFGFVNAYWTNQLHSTFLAWTLDVTNSQFIVFRATDTFLSRQAIAIRPGDVLAVPEPSSLSLLCLGGVALGWLQRRRRFQPDERTTADLTPICS